MWIQSISDSINLSVKILSLSLPGVLDNPILPRLNRQLSVRAGFLSNVYDLSGLECQMLIM